MAHARRRHYRVAQKAVEAQICQHEGEQRRDSILSLMIIIVLAAQLFNLALKIYELFSNNCSEI